MAGSVCGVICSRNVARLWDGPQARLAGACDAYRQNARDSYRSGRAVTECSRPGSCASVTLRVPRSQNRSWMPLSVNEIIPELSQLPDISAIASPRGVVSAGDGAPG